MSKMYLINGVECDRQDPAIQTLLASAYLQRHRPLCLCKGPPGLEMYIAKVEEVFYVKRMPGSADHHAAGCTSYDPPMTLSGLGELAGQAIREDAEAGVTMLKFDFSLSKLGKKAMPMPSPTESDTVASDGKKLSLRGMLHYLWEQAGLHRWEPGIERWRNWAKVHERILHAAHNKVAKNAQMETLLYCPEPYTIERKDEIATNRARALARLMQEKTANGSSKMMLCIGEVKEFEKARYDYKLVIKHQPQHHFMVSSDLHKRLSTRFAVELSAWSSSETGHLMACLTFGLNAAGYQDVSEATLMMTNEHWIPYENADDEVLLRAMHDAQRSFFKLLRYNMASTQPIANLVAIDTTPLPTAMCIIPGDAEESFEPIVRDMATDAGMDLWLWKVSETGLPSLPARTPLRIEHQVVVSESIPVPHLADTLESVAGVVSESIPV